MSKTIKIVGGAFVVVVALFVGAIAALKSMDINHFKEEIAAELKVLSGRDVKIDGELSLSVSLNPKLKVEGVSFANAPWGSRAQMITLKSLEAQVNLLSLVSGNIDINYITLSGLDLFLETNSKAKANWDFAKTPDSGETQSTDISSLPSVRDIRISDVKITYLDGVQKSRLSLNIPQMNFTAGNANEPMSAFVNAQLNSEPLEIVARLGSLKQFLRADENPFPLNVEITADGLLATLNGNVSFPETGMKLGFDANMAASNIDTISAMSGVKLPPFSKMNVAATLGGNSNNYSIEITKAAFGNSDISGNVSIDMSGVKPHVDAQLKSTLVDLNEIRGSESEKAKKSPAKDKLFSNEKIDFSFLNLMDGRIKYQAANLKSDHLKLNKLATNITLKNAKLSINPIELGVGNGFIKGRVDIANAGEKSKTKPSLSSRISARRVDVGKLLKELDFGNFLSLKTDVEIKFKSSGNSAHEIMAGLDGYARLVGSDGRLNDAVLATVSTGFMDALPWVANADSNIINCVVADFPVKSGVAVARRMFMDTNGMSVNASGSINLGKETIDLLISPVAKNVSLGSFAVPVGLTGTLAKPEFGINPAGAVVGTIGNVGKIVGSGAGSIGDLLGGVLGVGRNGQPPSEYDPCINLLSNKKSAPAPVSKKPKPQKSTTIDKVKDITKGIGQGIEQGIGGAIKGLFGN